MSVPGRRVHLMHQFLAANTIKTVPYGTISKKQGTEVLSYTRELQSGSSSEGTRAYTMVQAVKEQLQTGSGDGALMAGPTDSKATQTHTHTRSRVKKWLTI